jgi:hypothetical protein
MIKNKLPTKKILDFFGMISFFILLIGMFFYFLWMFIYGITNLISSLVEKC